ncbi:MAG: GNAT family N-acetyltransferase [Candidatus Poribacteria bacterium]|nr:GNAT family N-acetyltransferase [Candidatus Poribacteria bacterium]
MYKKLGNTVLKTGENMEVGVITAPDERHAEEVKQFLGHKGGNWEWHIEQCVTESLDELETRFYVGKIDGNIITNIMTVEHEGIGILGHVFTLPEQRRKGACKGVMAYQMEHFRQRNGRALYLGTGYNGHPYRIYHSFGFESVYPESGFMKYHVNENFEERYFAPASVQPKLVEWHDWPKLTVLSGIVEWDILRSLKWSVYGPTNFEGGFLSFKHTLETNDAYDDAKLLVTESGAIVGWATVNRDVRWRPAIAVLDLFFHPNFAESVPVLISALQFPELKVQCYVDDTAKKKAEVLEAVGFACEGRFKNQFTYNGEHHDVLVFGREVK